MKRVILLLLAFVILLSGCANSQGGSIMWRTVSQEEAMKIMEEEADYVILDVRTQAEYDEGHIPGAILIPYTEIDGKAEELIADKDIQILVYCRSGRRSKIAAQSLAQLGYTNVKEFGGIIDWKYDVVK